MLLEIPKFNDDVKIVGLKNFYKLRKTYAEIVGLEKIDHFSINIESPDGFLTFLSYNPSISLMLMQSGLLPYDGSVSPTIFRKRDAYIWDKVYNPKFSEKIKHIKEYKYGIDKGVVLVTKINGFYIMYSFATKKDGQELIENMLEYKEKFLQMGDHCYGCVRDIYNSYLT